MVFVNVVWGWRALVTLVQHSPNRSDGLVTLGGIAKQVFPRVLIEYPLYAFIEHLLWTITLNKIGTKKNLCRQETHIPVGAI